MTCKECKFFIQGTGHSGTCQKHPFQKSKSGQVYKKPDGTPIKFVVFWGTNACKVHFERKADIDQTAKEMMEDIK